MTKTIQQTIVGILKGNPTWWYGGTIDEYVRNIVGAKASNVGRRCRELHEAGVIERQLVQIDGKGAWVVQYKYHE